MSDAATLRVQKEKLKERLLKTEQALRASEDREFELRNEEEQRIAKQVAIKIKSLELAKQAQDSTRKRAQKEAQQLKVELSETHATFKQKLQIERDLRFRAVDELESMRATVHTMKKHNKLYAQRTQTLEVENERAIQQAGTKAQQTIQDLQQQLDTREDAARVHLENLNREKEARFEAETKRRHAERVAKRAKTSASAAAEELKTIKQKVESVQTRLDRASRGQRSALQAAKEAKEKTLMTLESTKKKLANKDTEIQKLTGSKTRALESASTLQHELERRVRELEQRIDTDRQAFQTERAQWSTLETDRDQAREQLSLQIGMGEKCKKEVENSEELLRLTQDELGQEKLKRLDVERRNAEKHLQETDSERSRVEMSMQLRARNKEMREIKQALEARGISLEFLIGKSIVTVDSPVVVRQPVVPSSTGATGAGAEARSPSSDYASPPQKKSSAVHDVAAPHTSNNQERLPSSPTSSPSSTPPQQALTTSNVHSLSPSGSMENSLSAPNSCDSPRHVSENKMNMHTTVNSSSDSDRSSLGGSISVDASLSNWKKKVEGASSGALWGVRRKETGLKPPVKKTSVGRPGRPLNPAAAAAMRRANNKRTVIKEL